MNNFNIKSFLTANAEIDNDFFNELISGLKIVKVKKGEILLHEGDICRHSFFVERGLLRYYSIDQKGKEHILQFAPEKWILTNRESVFFNQPSKYFIDALEESDLFFLETDFVSKIAAKNSGFYEFNNRLLHNHIRQLQNRINQLLSATAEERYLDFVKVYPDILLRVPQWMVASYLGITPESLSRIRKDLATKNFRKQIS